MFKKPQVQSLAGGEKKGSYLNLKHPLPVSVDGTEVDRFKSD